MLRENRRLPRAEKLGHVFKLSLLRSAAPYWDRLRKDARSDALVRNPPPVRVEEPQWQLLSRRPASNDVYGSAGNLTFSAKGRVRNSVDTSITE